MTASAFSQSGPLSPLSFTIVLLPGDNEKLQTEEGKIIVYSTHKFMGVLTK